MFRKMRLQARQMEDARAKELLKNGEYGVLAVADVDNQPYGVPLSYIYMDDAIYFHCAHKGQKADMLAANPKVCFTVVTRAQAYHTDTEISTGYESIIAFGTAAKIEDNAAKVPLLMQIVDKYLPGIQAQAAAYIDKLIEKTALWKITVTHLTGKEDPMP